MIGVSRVQRTDEGAKHCEKRGFAVGAEAEKNFGAVVVPSFRLGAVQSPRVGDNIAV